MVEIIKPDLSSGEIGPELYGRIDTNEYRKGLRVARNVIIHPYGGASNRPGTIFCGPCKDHVNPPRLIPFRFRTEDTYQLEFGDMYMRVLRNGYHVVETVFDITSITNASPAVVTTSVAHGYSAGDEVFIAGVNGPNSVNGGRFIIANPTATTFELTNQVTAGDISLTNDDAYVSGGQCARIYEIATPYAWADLAALKYTQSGDVVTLTHRSYDVKNLERLGHTNWQLVAPTFAPSIGSPASVTVTQNGATGSTTYQYRVTAIQDGTFLEGDYTQGSCANGNATIDSTNSITVSWSAVTGAFRYNIYKLENGLWGFMGTSESTSFTDNATVAPNTNTTPPLINNPFSTANDQPGSVGFYEQRKVYGNTNNKPDTTFYSRIGDYDNFDYSFPGQADDAIEATLNQREIDEIRHFVALNDLLVFTAGAEWAISAGSDAGFSSDTLRQRPQSTWGSSDLRPIVIGDKILFVQALSAMVRSIGFTYTGTGINGGYKGGDLTLLARHLFLDRQLKDWCYAQIPHSFVLIARDDGILLPLTFALDQNVIAWNHWDTKGSFISTSSIPNVGAGEDIPYFVVRRRVNGNMVNYIERLQTRQFTDVRDCYFVDCGLTMDGPHDIQNVSIGSDGSVLVECLNHGFMDGEEVDLSDIIWTPNVDQFYNETQPDQLNGGRFIVANSTVSTFTLNDTDGVAIDGSGFNTYLGGGFARCCVDKIWGLRHLVGEEVVMLGDGNVVNNLTVADDGSITLPRRMSRIQVGLRYISDIGTLNVELGQQTIQGVLKRIPGVTIRFKDSRGLYVGPDETHLRPMKWRTTEKMGDPTEMFTGEKHFNFDSTWDTNGRIFMRQLDPLPFTWTALIPDVAIAEPRV